MMNRNFFKLLPLLALGQFASAGTPVPEGAAAPAEAAAATDATASTPVRYQLKRKSEFNLETRARAPFWPIGWTKQGAPVVATKVNVDEGMFRVTSILIGNPSMAVINGRSYEEGQFLRVPKSSPVRPRLYRIGDGEVMIQVQNQLVTVQLRRPTLKEAAPETELLNEQKDDPLPLPTVTSTR